MAIKILMPALSPTMTKGNLSKWYKGEGDSVEPGELIAEIETDKAIMEVEAVDSGTLGKIIVPAGSENIPINKVIGFLLEDGEDLSSMELVENSIEETQDSNPTEFSEIADIKNEKEIRATPLARRLAEQSGVDLTKITGTGPRDKVVRADVQVIPGDSDAFATSSSTSDLSAKGQRLFVSPLARRLAKEEGLILSEIVGTGPQGRIIKNDIEKAKLTTGVETAAGNDGSESERYEVLPMSAMRKVIAERMVHSKSTVPHFYLSVDCEIDELLKLRSSLNDRLKDVKLSVNDFIIWACAMALIEVPKANSSWVGDGTVRQYKTADISVAVSLDEGLVTPIIQSAESLGLAKISEKMKDLALRAREGKLLPEEYQGGSFTISNLGMFGIKQFDAVINEPQGCILAVGAGEERPVVKNGQIVPAMVMSCTLSCDHRVVDGATGAKLLSEIKRILEYPAAMLL